jgi:microsomal epoxide hydrolase
MVEAPWPSSYTAPPVKRLTLAAALLSLAVTLGAQGEQVKINDGFIKTRDGVQLHYLEAGRGPALLFIPGFTGAAEFWDPQIRAFSGRHRVIAIDPRSQGDSEKTFDGNHTDSRAQDIRDVITSLNLAPVVIVAWSRAVTETLSYIEQFGPEAIRGVVLVDGAVMRMPGPQALANVAAEAKALQQDRRAYTEKSARGMFRRSHPEDFYRSVINANLKTPTAVAVALQADAIQFDYRGALRKLNRPIMFASQGDAPSAQAKLVLAEVPAARVETFPGSGHALFLDDPERFNAVLADFIASLSTN